jgi:D-aminoacyl-tRNA deacylase
MRAVIQRVTEASVSVGDHIIASIGAGLAILIGVTHDDNEADSKFLAQKIATLRIFEDQSGKFNLSALDVGASALVVSQFTLYADTRRGRRPDFIEAARPEVAEPLIDKFVSFLRDQGLQVKTGKFQAHMLVKIFNDGPVTIILDSGKKNPADEPNGRQ